MAPLPAWLLQPPIPIPHPHTPQLTPACTLVKAIEPQLMFALVSAPVGRPRTPNTPEPWQKRSFNRISQSDNDGCWPRGLPGGSGVMHPARLTSPHQPHRVDGGDHRRTRWRRPQPTSLARPPNGGPEGRAVLHPIAAAAQPLHESDRRPQGDGSVEACCPSTNPQAGEISYWGLLTGLADQPCPPPDRHKAAAAITTAAC